MNPPSTKQLSATVALANDGPSALGVRVSEDAAWFFFRRARMRKFGIWGFQVEVARRLKSPDRVPGSSPACNLFNKPQPGLGEPRVRIRNARRKSWGRVVVAPLASRRRPGFHLFRKRDRSPRRIGAAASRLKLENLPGQVKGRQVWCGCACFSVQKQAKARVKYLPSLHPPPPCLAVCA